MKGVRRELLALVALFAALVAFIAFGPLQSDEGQGGSPTTYASADAGALALYQWLDAIGYDAQRLEYSDFALAPSDDLLFVLAPAQTYRAEEADALLAWVEAGGTLVLADDRPGQFSDARTILRALDLRIERLDEGAIGAAPILQPAIGEPPAVRLLANTRAVVRGERGDLAILAGTPNGEAVLVGLQRGEGYVYVSSARYPFTNAGLRDPQNAAVVLNMLRRVPDGGRIRFDEIHHGFVSQPSLRGLLMGSPWGWAILYALLIGAAYLVATSRRFGRPVPLREEVARRSSAEYLESMAGLLRRGGKRAYIAAHFRAALKRRLARPAGLAPTEDDAAFVGELAALRSIDAATLSRLLARLRRPDLSEQELLSTIAETDRLEAR